MTRTKKAKAKYHDYYDLIFRGYGEDDHIKRKEGATLHTFEEVASSRDLFGVFREDIIMIDADDHDTANTIHNILVETGVKFYYQMTDRGQHFFFRKGKLGHYIKSNSNQKTAIGLVVDYKNSANDGTKLVKDSTPREILEGENGGDLQDLPCWLTRIKTDMEVANLQNGDGRNDTLFNYILVLMRFHLNKDEIRQIIKLINNYCFTEKLSDRELKTILRDEAFPSIQAAFTTTEKDYTGKAKTKVLYEGIADYVIAEQDICKIEDELYRYKDGVYTVLDSDGFDSCVMNTIKGTNINFRRELKPHIKERAEAKQLTSYNYICFKNGVYDIVNDVLLPHNKEYVFVNQIPHSYDPDAKPVELIDTFLKNLSCNDTDVIQLLIEMIGYCFYRRNKLTKFFIIVGEGENGKSTFLDYVKYILGETNTSEQSLQELCSDKFGTWMLKDKLLNVGDDIDKEFVEKTGIIKKLVDGNTFMSQQKGKNQFKLTYTGKLMFSCNEIPRFKDDTHGWERRKVIVPFYADFKNNKSLKIPFIEEKITHPECVEYTIKLAVQALRKIINDGFIEPQVVIDRTEQNRKDNNPILQFVEERDIEGVNKKELYLAYQVWCKENGCTFVSSNVFSRSVSRLGYNTVSTKDKARNTVYYFTKSKDSQLMMS
ncbi:MAG: primase C-terminal domain-containing protein [Clostridiales bacterium]|jgi:putative DNA primase/helicase|nr:primase C-terminal domain-containing protein [Clostridiales bacterium]